MPRCSYLDLILGQGEGAAADSPLVHLWGRRAIGVYMLLWDHFLAVCIKTSWQINTPTQWRKIYRSPSYHMYQYCTACFLTKLILMIDSLQTNERLKDIERDYSNRLDQANKVCTSSFTCALCVLCDYAIYLFCYYVIYLFV